VKKKFNERGFLNEQNKKADAAASTPRPAHRSTVVQPGGRCLDMSGQLVGKLLLKNIPGRTVKLVLLALAERCPKEHPECFPGEQWIANVAQCSLRTARRVLHQAQQLGYVKKIQPSSPGQPIRWRLDFDTMPDLTLKERRPRVTAVGESTAAISGMERRPNPASTAAISGTNGGETGYRNNVEPELTGRATTTATPSTPVGGVGDFSSYDERTTAIVNAIKKLWPRRQDIAGTTKEIEWRGPEILASIDRLLKNNIDGELLIEAVKLYMGKKPTKGCLWPHTFFRAGKAGQEPPWVPTTNTLSVMDHR
jgi:hypothetical protein